MSLDASLKSASSLVRHRNVLTRGERLDLLAGQGKWDTAAKGVFGLPKVGHRKLVVGKAPKAEGEEAAAAAPAAKGAKGAPAAKAAAPAAKGAAPAKGAPAAKAAAPAAKKK